MRRSPGACWWSSNVSRFFPSKISWVDQRAGDSYKKKKKRRRRSQVLHGRSHSHMQDNMLGRVGPALLEAVYRDICDTPAAQWKPLHIIPGQQQVNGTQVKPRCISSDQEHLIDSELWWWIRARLPKIKVKMETRQFTSNSCFSWPQQREHFHSSETAPNWNVWICALMCVWLFSLLICG